MGCTDTFRAVYMIRGPKATFTDQGPAGTVTFFRITRKIFKFETCHFKIIARNVKPILRENFSPLRFDSGKIFKIIIFTRGPRTTCCTVHKPLQSYPDLNTLIRLQLPSISFLSSIFPFMFAFNFCNHVVLVAAVYIKAGCTHEKPDSHDEFVIFWYKTIQE